MNFSIFKQIMYEPFNIKNILSYLLRAEKKSTAFRVPNAVDFFLVILFFSSSAINLLF